MDRDRADAILKESRKRLNDAALEDFYNYLVVRLYQTDTSSINLIECLGFFPCDTCLGLKRRGYLDENLDILDEEKLSFVHEISQNMPKLTKEHYEAFLQEYFIDLI